MFNRIRIVSGLDAIYMCTGVLPPTRRHDWLIRPSIPMSSWTCKGDTRPVFEFSLMYMAWLTSVVCSYSSGIDSPIILITQTQRQRFVFKTRGYTGRYTNAGLAVDRRDALPAESPVTFKPPLAPQFTLGLSV